MKENLKYKITGRVCFYNKPTSHLRTHLYAALNGALGKVKEIALWIERAHTQAAATES